MAKSEPDRVGIDAAREYARWHLGDADWADNIIEAYLNPEAAHAQLAKDRAKYAPVAADTGDDDG